MSRQDYHDGTHFGRFPDDGSRRLTCSSGQKLHPIVAEAAPANAQGQKGNVLRVAVESDSDKCRNRQASVLVDCSSDVNLPT